MQFNLSDTRTTMALSDTSEKAREVYFQRLEQMTPSERLRLGASLWRWETPCSAPPCGGSTRTRTKPKSSLKLR